MRAARRKPHLGSVQLALLFAAGCSLQNFDYLQQGSGGSSSGGTSSTAGNSSAGTENGEGGEAAAPSGSGGSGGKGGSQPSGGTDAGADPGGSDTGGAPQGGGGKGGGGNGGTGGSGGGGGTGATGQLVNGSFETGTIKGWTVEPAKALMNPPRYAYVQTATPGASVQDGVYEFSTWHGTDEFTVNLFQTIEGLKDGTYVFKGYFNFGGSHKSVKLYAKDCGGADPDPITILPAGPADWPPHSIENIEVEGGKCTVGVEISSNPEGWLNADLFTLERVSGPDGGGGDGQGGAN
jgi:hypothetical protein